jgi:YhhN family
MKLIKQYGLFIFWAILILDCLICVFASHNIRVYTKPLLLPALAAYFFVNTKRSKHIRSKTLVYSSLAIAWVGDWLLLENDIQNNTNDSYLMFGMIALIVALSIYGWMFKKMSSFNIKDCQEAFLSAVAVTVVSILFYKFLKVMPLGKLKYVIIAGMITMTAVMSLAANVHQDKVRKNMAYQFFVPGIIILGIVVAHKFLLADATFLPAVIVLTYGFGQMLMIRGFTKYLKA